jgi:PEP-CTERM motif
MKLKFLAIASAMAVASLSSQATAYSWGSHDQLESALGGTAGGVIFDTFSFTLGGSSSVASSVTSFGVIAPASYSLFSTGFDGMVGTADDTGVASWTFGGAPVVHSVTLGAGSYYYSVFGAASGFAAYSINSSAVAAVPEPETYAMLAAGLGIVGFVASRRRRND